MHVEHHPGSYEIVHIKDSAGHSFATRLSNIFIIGSKKSLIALPKRDGLRQTLLEERASKIRQYANDDDEEEEDDE